MKVNLFDKYEPTTPITDALLREIGFKQPYYVWDYLCDGCPVVPEIHQEGEKFFIETDNERYPGLRENESDNYRKYINTIGELKKCYEKAAVLNRFDVEEK